MSASLRKRLGALALAAAAGALCYACVESTSSRPAPEQTTTSNGSGPSGSGSTGSGQSFDRKALLSHLATEVILPTYQEFVSETAALEAAAAAYAGSLDPADRDTLREAWKSAMAVWQRAELMQVGPAGKPDQTPGGQDLRDQIYSWDYVNACAVDQKLVERSYEDPVAFANQLIIVRGLDAMEYLLFHEGTDNACAPQNSINASGSWQQIVPELDQRRAAYAHTLAVLLVQRAAELRDAWAPESGNFAGKLSAPDAALYGSEQAALGAVAGALMYLDLITKDMKLAVPCGLSECAYPVCPEELEAGYSAFSKQALEENIRGFQLVFLGGPPGEDALGFDDWLSAVGAQALAQEMGAEIDAAFAALAAVEEDDLGEALAQDPDSVRAVHAAVKALTDDLKTQFVTLLDLELPMGPPGDND